MANSDDSMEMLNSEQAAAFMSMSVSNLHKLTSGRRIKCYRRKHSNRLFFKREDLLSFLQGDTLEALR